MIFVDLVIWVIELYLTGRSRQSCQAWMPMQENAVIIYIVNLLRGQLVKVIVILLLLIISIHYYKMRVCIFMTPKKERLIFKSWIIFSMCVRFRYLRNLNFISEHILEWRSLWWYLLPIFAPPMYGSILISMYYISAFTSRNKLLC